MLQGVSSCPESDNCSSPHTDHAQQAKEIGIRTKRLCTRREMTEARSIGANA